MGNMAGIMRFLAREGSIRLSHQLHVSELAPGWKGVYSPFGHRVAFVFHEAWEALTRREFHRVSPQMLEYLVENNILVEQGFEERWLRENLPSYQVGFNSMYLVVTQGCNFGCKYCAVVENIDSSERLKEKMSPETGKKAVEFFARELRISNPPDARVTFYGGEPMLNKELIFELVPRIKEISYPGQTQDVEVVMITNGYLYDPNLTELFKEYGVGVCLSLDGTRRHQDATRVTRDGRLPTFNRVVENFRRYRDAGLSMGVSTALGSHNVRDLKEISLFYAELGAHFVEFQIPYQVANESNLFWVSTTELTGYLMDAYETLRTHNIVEGTTYRRLKDFATGRIHTRDCGANGNQLVVAPDGSIGPCHSLVGTRKFFEGNVREPCNPRKMKNFTEWAARFPLNMAICKGCPYISLCGGGCTYNSYISTGTIWNKDPQVCEYMKGMVDWILKDLWKETGMEARYGSIEQKEG